MTPAAAIAAARATGSVALEPAESAALAAACERIGRRAVGLGGHAVAVAWQDGYGPDRDDPAVKIATLPPTTLIALGLALAVCMQPHRRLPGRAAAAAEFDAALDRLLADRASADRAPGGTAAFVKGALVALHEIGLLDVEEDTIMLGPALAAWSDADWSTAHALAERLTTEHPA